MGRCSVSFEQALRGRAGEEKALQENQKAEALYTVREKKEV